MTSYFNKRDAIKNLPADHIIINRNIKEYLYTKNYTTFLELIKESQEPCYYEFIGKHVPVCLFFDIEISSTKHSEHFTNDHKLIDIIKSSVLASFKDCDTKFIILESHNEQKRSYHIIVRIVNQETGINIMFKNVEELKTYVNSLQDLSEYINLGIVDTSVYREGLFRTIYSSKFGENRPLVYSNLTDLREDLQTFVSYIQEPYEFTQSQEIGLVKVQAPTPNVKTGLTTKQKTDIKKFVKESYKHKPKDIRDIHLNTELNCILISLNETYCEFVEREHQSNHQYIVIDTHSSKQKCHDSDCEGQKFNEIKIQKYPEYLVDIVKSVLQFDDQEFSLLQSGRDQVVEYIRTNFDDRTATVDFDQTEEVFRSNVQNRNLVGLLRGQCRECDASHEIGRTGYCVKCLVCKTVFPATARIPNPDSLNKFFTQYTQLVNNGTIQNNITIYNGGEIEPELEFQIEDSILQDNDITKLVNETLDGHKITKLAELLHHVNDNFVYDSDWYNFDGSKWIVDKKNILMKRDILDLIKVFNKVSCHYSNARSNDASTRLIKNIKSLSNKLSKPAFKDDIIKEAMLYYYEDGFCNKLNNKKHLVPFTNGVYDLLGNEFRKSTKEDYINLTTNFDYDISVNNQEVHTFLERIMPNKSVRDYVLKKMSECLNGDIPNTSFLMFIGDGANGKSQLLNLMQITLGSFAEKADVTLLTRKRNDASEANSEKAKLINKRFAFFSEPEDGEKINIGLLKELTGSEEIVARELYQQSRSFIMEAKFFLACNELPAIKAEDSALWRRIRVIDFPSRFVDNPVESNEYKIDRTLPSKIREDITWKQTFMNILLTFYNKDICEPNEVQVKTNEYREDNNEYEQWFDENLRYAKDAILKASDLAVIYFTGKPKPNNHIKNKLFKELEKYTKRKLQNVDHVCKVRKHDNKTYRGWVDLQIDCE